MREGETAVFLRDLLREALNRGKEDKLYEIIGANRLDLTSVLTGESLILESSQDGINWQPVQESIADLLGYVDEIEVLQKLKSLDLNQNTSVSFSRELPPHLVECLAKYWKAGYIDLEEDGEDKVKVTCRKERGLYDEVAGEIKNMQYKLREIGGDAQKLEEILEKIPQEERPFDKLNYQNIGNVPNVMHHPAFMITTELSKRYPGLFLEKFQNRDLRELTTEEWDQIYDHKLPGYPPTGGVKEFVDYARNEAQKRAEKYSAEGATHILKSSDIIPTCGAAQAISNLRHVIGGNKRFYHFFPGYPAQTGLELALAKQKDRNAKLIGSDLKLEGDEWKPDLQHLRKTLEESAKEKIPTKQIGIISIIHPSNPTGHLWTKNELKELFEIAKDFGVIVEVDATYCDVYDDEYLEELGEEYMPADVMASKYGVPTIIHRSVSKDALKCGDKFGWAEFYNFGDAEDENDGVDPELKAIKRGFFNTMQSGVGATAIQRIMPAIYQHPEYKPFNREMRRRLYATATALKTCFDGVPGVTCVRPKGAMYTSIIFDEGVFERAKKDMEITDPRLRAFVEQKTAKKEENIPPVLQKMGYNPPKERPEDEKFLLHLMAKTGVVASPLSGFEGGRLGFRICNFADPEEVMRIFMPVAKATREYLEPKEMSEEEAWKYSKLEEEEAYKFAELEEEQAQEQTDREWGKLLQEIDKAGANTDEKFTKAQARLAERIAEIDQRLSKRLAEIDQKLEKRLTGAKKYRRGLNPDLLV